ncbi:hypothetical protein Cgig2_003381 [Carnegiea gigantea]|uniref:Uncharacterized protein n=1 Tax=Carnegiea gigantea TaxID=171969 RepID=A0A9Q1GLY4_9CARY|nr:hypothetical protein Cgig2_003381 [Carnegiea gigantea]
MFRNPSFRRKWYNRRGGKTKNDWYSYFPFHHGISSSRQHQGDGRLCERILHLVLKDGYTSASPLLEDYHVRCSHFSLPKVEGEVADFELPEMVQATFYTMLLNKAVELGVVHGFMAKGLRSALVGLWWSSFEVRSPSNRSHVERLGWPAAPSGVVPHGILVSSLYKRSTEQAAEYIHDHFRWSLRDLSDPGPRPLPSDNLGLCPRFDLGVATRYLAIPTPQRWCR